MPCKIGVTKNLEEKRAHVEMIYRTAKDWHTLGTFDDKESAVAAQRRLVAQMGCDEIRADEEEGEMKGQWHVYCFSHGKQPRIAEFGGIKTLKTEQETKKK